MLSVHRRARRLRLRPRRPGRSRRERRSPTLRSPFPGPRRRPAGPGRLATASTAALAVVTVVAVVHPAPAAAQAPPVVDHHPPVDAPVADPFRPPAGPYGAGNRGIEYDTEPGTEVRASASGTVAFAGPVGGASHVSIDHADGVRTSYSHLASIEVTVGARVTGGQRVGTAGDRLHFGARHGGAYLDPAGLFGAAVTEVELLPFEVPPGSTPDAEARALAALVMADDRSWVPDLGSVGDWLRARVDAGRTYAGQLDPRGRGLDLAADLVERVVAPAPCSSHPPPVRPVAGRDRVAVTVAGLGSSSASASVDDLRHTELGYADGDVVRFSYVGGRAPGTGAAFPAIDARPYESDDTQGDVRAAALRLADLLQEVVEARPSATVDVYAHSLGGVVTRLALTELDRRGADLGHLGLVTTFGSPHTGADAATAVAAADSHPLVGPGLELAGPALGIDLDPDAPVVAQLAEGSGLMGELAAAGVPGGVRVLSLAGRGDLVVTAPRTRLPGATNVTVAVGGATAHSRLVGSDPATEEIARALAGGPPGCESWSDAVADVVTGHAISAAEDALGGRMAL